MSSSEETRTAAEGIASALLHLVETPVLLRRKSVTKVQRYQTIGLVDPVGQTVAIHVEVKET